MQITSIYGSVQRRSTLRLQHFGDASFEAAIGRYNNDEGFPIVGRSHVTIHLRSYKILNHGRS
jgi:hypothetical protein